MMIIRALEAIRTTIDDLNLRDELEASMADELKIRGIFTPHSRP